MFKINLSLVLSSIGGVASATSDEAKPSTDSDNQNSMPTMFSRVSVSKNHRFAPSVLSSVANESSSMPMMHYGEAVSYHDFLCSKHTSCAICQMDPSCVWNSRRCEYFNQYLNALNSRPVYKKPNSCQSMCSEHRSCLNCTTLANLNGQYHQNECVWCASQNKCLLRKAIMIMYPFNECLQLVNDREQCEALSSSGASVVGSLSNLFVASDNNGVLMPTMQQQQQQQQQASECAKMYSNCSACIQDERCGWCTRDLGSFGNREYERNTGFGECMEGGQSSALNAGDCRFNWFYSLCPDCECNGHSTCVRNGKLNWDRFFLIKFKCLCLGWTFSFTFLSQ